MKMYRFIADGCLRVSKIAADLAAATKALMRDLSTDDLKFVAEDDVPHYEAKRATHAIEVDPLPERRKQRTPKSKAGNAAESVAKTLYHDVGEDVV